MRMVYASAYGIRFVDLVKTRRCGVADHGEPVLTPGIASAWGASVREPKGRRRLSLTKIVDAGVALATRDGLASVSMGRLAAELDGADVAVSARGRQTELLALMVDAAAGPAPDIPEPDEDWRSATTRWTRAFVSQRCATHGPCRCH